MALLFAFHDDHALCNDILQAQNMKSLLDAVQRQPLHSMYVVVDQRNALELNQNGVDLEHDVKVDALNNIDVLRSTQRYIFSASANEQSDRDRVQKQSGIDTINLHTGIEEVETTTWYKHHKAKLPALSEEEREWIEGITGRNPFLLQALFKMKEFNETKFLTTEQVAQVETNVAGFYNDLFAKPNYTAELRAQCLEHMEAILQANSVMGPNRSLYDLRYFYFDDEKIGRSSCGMAFRTLLAVYRRHNDNLDTTDAWYTAISLSPNPTVVGYLAEHMCLVAIQRGGLGGTALKDWDAKLGKRMESKQYFLAVPELDHQVKTDQELRLYIPTTFNFPDIDGAIIRLDRRSKRAYVYLIQVTVAKTHKDSEKSFYKNQWPTWEDRLKKHGFKASSIFIWVDRGEPSIEPVPKKNPRKPIVPKRRTIHISIQSVDPHLHHALVNTNFWSAK